MFDVSVHGHVYGFGLFYIASVYGEMGEHLLLPMGSVD